MTKKKPGADQSDDKALHVRALQVRALPRNLVALAPSPSDLSCWLGDSIEIVAWGTAMVLPFEGRHAMRSAARAWQQVCEEAHVDAKALPQEAALPAEMDEVLQLPLALASFGFASSTTGYLVVPSHACVRVHQEGGSQSWLVTAAVGEKPADPASVVEQKIKRIKTPSGLWTDPGRMTQSKWKDAVRRLIGMLRAGAASKVVLARDIVVSSPNPVDERYLVSELEKRYGTTWVYAVEGLIGATPEMLASLENGFFSSRVLAGTAEPGQGAILMDSIKNRSEHHLAVESVARAISPISETMNVPLSPELLELPNVTHLATEVTAIVPNASVLDIVDALHPTAAVCGTPTKLAFQILESLEGTQRGRYAGPVGWVDGAGDGEFAIALRCGQLFDGRKKIRVFAGGGIMPDSNPDMELAETRAKMRPVLQALGLES